MILPSQQNENVCFNRKNSDNSKNKLFPFQRQFILFKTKKNYDPCYTSSKNNKTTHLFNIHFSSVKLLVIKIINLGFYNSITIGIFLLESAVLHSRYTNNKSLNNKVHSNLIK